MSTIQPPEQGTVHIWFDHSPSQALERYGIDRALIERSPRGKPLLRGDAQIEFNHSHTDGLTVTAIASTQPVGVDIERLRPRSLQQSIAQRHFSPFEREQLQAVDDEQRHSLFYRIWTAKEAVLKGIGSGLTVPLDSVSVDASLERPAVAGVENWSIAWLDTPDGYAGCVALEADRVLPVVRS